MGNCCGGESTIQTVSEPLKPQQDDEPIICKVVCIGERYVGKSSMVLRYTQDNFNDNYSVTIGAAFATKVLELQVGENQTATLNLHIWDTAGEEQYRSMTRFFYREALVGIVTYDSTNAQTVEKLESWISDLRSESPDAIVFIVGNKIDGEKVVPTDRMKQFADANGYYFAECSAKTGENIKELFEKVACIAYQQKTGNPTMPMIINSSYYSSL